MKKTVLITSSAKGIGKAMALKYASLGYNLVISYYKSKTEAHLLKTDIEEKYKSDVLLVKCDISSENEIINMINKTKEKFKKIDILINNASFEQSNNYMDKTKDEFMKVLEVNVVGTFLVTKHALSIIKNGGVVINISSLDSCKTYNELSIDYSASKAGVNSLSQTFSLINKNIKFISILLPWVNTESVQLMLPSYLESELKRVNQKKLLEPSYVADKIYELSVDEKVISGSLVEVK